MMEEIAEEIKLPKEWEHKVLTFSIDTTSGPMIMSFSKSGLKRALDSLRGTPAQVYKVSQPVYFNGKLYRSDKEHWNDFNSNGKGCLQ